ncbi:hypothetical protein [Streptomyces goshikiensis]
MDAAARDEQLRRLEADIEDARKALNQARRRFDALCDEYGQLKRGAES